MLGRTEQDIIEHIARLKEESVIRQISAIFNPAALGYRTCLVAMAVDSEDLDQAVQAMSQEPGISHNYLREGELNMWFTIAVPPGLHLQSEIDRLSTAVRARRTLVLPAVKIYKIAVVMNMGGEDPEEQDRGPTDTGNHADAGVTLVPVEAEVEMIRCIQEDLPLSNRPFLDWARSLSREEDYLLDWIKSSMETGVIRRFAALLRHRKVGFRANAMVAWRCPEHLVDSLGETIASQPEVTHCYRREPASGWPYNLYAMIHGRDRGECERAVESLGRLEGLDYCRMLYTIRELKKERLKLFWKKLSAGAV